MAEPARDQKPYPTTEGGTVIANPAIAIARDDFDRDVHCVLGLPIDTATIDMAVARIDRAIDEKRRLSFVTPNVNWLVRASRDAVARREIVNADYSLADGAPVALAARMLGVPGAGRVAGSDLFEALRRRPAFSGRKIRVFFFGGRDGSAQSACAALEGDGGALAPAGWLNPGFGGLEDMSTEAIMAQINDAAPDFLVVALGAAKGQAWIEKNQHRLTAPVIAHLGAVVDFTGGAVTRAPGWMGRAGLEWLWRIKEDRGLWRRYAGDAIALCRLAATRFLLAKAALETQRARGRGTATLQRDGSEPLIVLSGDFGKGGLGAIRRVFREAAATGRSVIIDGAQLGRVDSAFLGTLLMLEKATAQAGQGLELRGFRRLHRTLLAVNGLWYPEKAKPHIRSGEQDEIPAARRA